MKNHGLRIVRGWIGALLCTCLAAASHALVDGDLPPLPILGLLLCISAAICTSLASRRISLLRTSLAVMLSQGAYHGAFALFGHQHQASGLIHENTSLAGHAAHTLTLNVDTSAAAVAAVDPSNSWLMPLAHLVAAIVTVMALRRGEIAVRALVDAVSLYVPRLILFIRSLPSVRGKQPLLGVAYRSLVLRDVLRPALHRRGPPRGPAFAFS
ncbi:hypothetical protein [Paeniglutamicibacter sp.]|uniref:hypothetical protein n=1 Tax=Paeniglutamicibacter sp. TaxID=1934391 RepID=UPI003989047B